MKYCEYYMAPEDPTINLEPFVHDNMDWAPWRHNIQQIYIEKNDIEQNGIQ